MVRLNAVDFDNSIVFCGRGDEKNNFLMEMYLKNEEDKATMYTVFDRNVPSFLKNIDSSFAIRKSFYLKRKAEIGWDDTFDSLAKASLDFHHITKKEIYPYAHQFRNGKNIRKALPADYYAHRKAVNYESNELANYSPFIKYVSMMLNNMTYEKNKGNLSENSIENNIEKLNLTKNLIKNEKTRNVVLNNVALMYLLEDQNMYNNTKFIERYLELSTDAALEKEIRTIYTAVQNLKVGNTLPKIDLVNAKNEKINLTTLITKPTVLYFWTTHAESHMAIAHQKINALQKEHPNYQFIAINIDDTQPNWNEALKKYQLNTHFELHATDFEAIRNKWVITKIHRIIILNADGTIKNGFANLFDVNFENQLQ
jgi:peroxiredoxin